MARGRTQRALGWAGLGSGESCSSRARAPEPLPAPEPPPPLPAPGPAAVGAMRSPSPAADVSTAGGGPDVGTAGRSSWKVPLFGTYLEKAPGGTASSSSSSRPAPGSCPALLPGAPARPRRGLPRSPARTSEAFFSVSSSFSCASFRSSEYLSSSSSVPFSFFWRCVSSSSTWGQKGGTSVGGHVPVAQGRPPHSQQSCPCLFPHL